MDINFEYYKVFYYVAKYKNMTKAAAAMRSSQPNITRIIRILEEELQCRLLTREARGISLTKEGEQLYSHVEIAFRQLQNAQEELRADTLDGGGTVEIGATETALHVFLLDALREFKKVYPRVKIKIHNNSTPEILKSLVYGRLDFAVVTAPFEISGQLISRELAEFAEILVGGPQYRELSLKKRGLSELKEYSWVGLGAGTATYKWYKEIFLKYGADIEPDTEVATSDLLIPLIQDNMGIGFVPENMAKPLLAKKKLVRIYTDFALPDRKISLVFDRGRARSAISGELQKFLTKR